MIPNTYEYNFEAARLRVVPENRAPNNRVAWLRQFTSDAQVVLDTLLKYNPPQIPLMTPLPGHSINLKFSEPLPTSVLQQLVRAGYHCQKSPGSDYCSDKAAE